MSRLSSDGGDIWSREAACRYCERLARTHYENFTVGSWFLPREKRRYAYAIYGFCRTVDDLGDEASNGAPPIPSKRGKQRPYKPLLRPAIDPHPNLLPHPTLILEEHEHRLALLDRWQSELQACYSGTPSHPVMVALQETIRTFDIPPDLFLKLIEANRMDQCIQRHPTYQGLLNYCDHSANPVGHLFLYLFG